MPTPWGKFLVTLLSSCIATWSSDSRPIEAYSFQAPPQGTLDIVENRPTESAPASSSDISQADYLRYVPLPRYCYKQIESAIINAGFSSAPNDFILSQFRSDSSSDLVSRRLWNLPEPPVEISQIAYPREKGLYYVNLTVSPPHNINVEMPIEITLRLTKLQQAIHETVDCVQTLRIEFSRTGPYECTYYDMYSRKVREIQALDLPMVSNPVLGVDFCE